MTPEERILQRVKQARMRLGISQEEAGRRLGVTLRTYARWERGESDGWVGRLANLAKTLNTTEEDLLGGENPLSTGPTVEQLNAKIDTLLEELQRLRVDFEESRPPASKSAAHRSRR